MLGSLVQERTTPPFQLYAFTFVEFGVGPYTGDELRGGNVVSGGQWRDGLQPQEFRQVLHILFTCETTAEFPIPPEFLFLLKKTLSS